MIGPAPASPWDGKMKPAGEFVSKEKFADGSKRTLRMFAITEDAEDSVKIAYEKLRNGLNLSFFAPEMDDPYYTWEGKIVERSSLKDRELPLAD